MIGGNAAVKLAPLGTLDWNQTVVGDTVVAGNNARDWQELNPERVGLGNTDPRGSAGALAFGVLEAESRRETGPRSIGDAFDVTILRVEEFGTSYREIDNRPPCRFASCIVIAKDVGEKIEFRHAVLILFEDIVGDR